MNAIFRKVKKYLSILQEQIYFGQHPVENVTICPCGYKTGHTPPPLSEFIPYTLGEIWQDNQPDRHAWFHFSVDVDGVSEENQFQLQLDSCGNHVINRPQFMLYVNGELRQGMDANHTYAIFDQAGHYDIYLYAYTGRMVTCGSSRIPSVIASPSVFSVGLLASTRRVRVEIEKLYYDIKVPLDTLEFLDPNSREYAQTLAHLDRAVSMLDLFEVGSPVFFASVRAAQTYMTEEFYGNYCHEQPTTVLCVGHTHIDCAWLWTLQQTGEKVQRSFSTVVELMRRYPEYKFTSSQPLLYRKLKEEAPQIYKEVKRLVKEGRWECEGAMWVEADCNLTSGESLVRQIIYGKRFFREEFGKDNRILWLPDVFGYSAALPQILKKSGVDWFVTSKIAWNDTNTMPYETFRWQGIDGTEINSYFLTSKNITQPDMRITYCGETTPDMIAGTYDRYSQKSLTDEVMIPYGYGDGGGGPTAEFLEMIRRESKGIPGIPNAGTGFLGEFFERMERRMVGQTIPKWRGELYLEFHRGTYTAVSKNKRNNRRSEFLYLNAELMSVLGRLMLNKPFPKAELRRGWEMILTNQFHDIIPGSSIQEVYDQSDKDYAEIQRIGAEIVDSAQQAIAASLDQKNGYVVFNPHSFVGKGSVVIDGVTVLVEEIPPKGYACVKNWTAENHVRIDGRTVETDVFTVRFDEHWQMISLYDKINRKEILHQGEIGNEIRVYPDHPDAYDAWEWQEYSLGCYEAMTDVSDATVMDDGARRGIRLVRPYRHSTLTQTMWFYDSIARIEFETVADWHEQHLMVKAAFPVNINSDKASYEIQFGTVERPTHKNTSWEQAKFEVCGHKYADLSDNGYGVAIINDCKYGYDIHDSVMQLSLFKCSTHPNAADEGEIVFTYALCPHAGTLAQSDVAEQAFLLNATMTARKATGKADLLPLSYSAVSVNNSHVLCETVKEAEDGEALIFRLHEYKNISERTEITFGFDLKSVKLCDLLERDLQDLPLCGRSVTVDMGGFEILTLKVVPK